MCREYIQDTLPAFAEQNPHIDVLTLKKRNKFPLVKAEYGKHPQQLLHVLIMYAWSCASTASH